MPTAVERFTKIFSDSVALDAIGNPAGEILLPYFERQLDSGLAALNGATSPRAFAAAERHYGVVFEALGAGAHALGRELQHDAVLFNALNTAAGGDDALTGTGGGSGFGDGGGAGRFLRQLARAAGFGGGAVEDSGGYQTGGSGFIGRLLSQVGFGDGGGAGKAFGEASADLFKAGQDLATFGDDHARLGHAHSKEEFVALERKLTADAKALALDFTASGDDMLRFGSSFADANGGASPSALFGQAVNAVGSDLSQLGLDFGKFADSGGYQTGGSGTVGFGEGGGAGRWLDGVHGHISALDDDLQGLGAPLAGLLVPAVRPA